MKLSSWLIAGALGLGWLGACGKASPGEQLGGETHWLRLCSESEQCGADLECLCGVCTRVCEDASSCEELGSDATCATASDTEFASGCESAAPPKLCVRGDADEPDEANGTPVFGTPFQTTTGCFGALDVAGSRTDPRLDCLPIETLAADGAGNCWKFSNTCLPDGFALLNPFLDYACREADGVCSASSVCRREEVLTPDGCLSCDAAYARLWGDVTALTLENGWNTCNSDLDCVILPWRSGCVSDVCGTLLAASSTQSFLTGVSEVVSQHCSDPEDWTRRCPELVPDCAGGTPICRQGRCVIGDSPCADRPLDTCEADGDCALARAFPFDVGQQCFAEATIAVGCIDPDLSCPPVTTPALDGDGNCFLFGNCLPAGFEQAPEGHACAAALGSTCAN